MNTRDTIASYMRARYPGALPEQIETLVTEWINNAGAQAEFYASSGLENLRDIVTGWVEKANPHLVGKVPTADELLKHLIAKQTMATGRPVDGPELEALKRRVTGLTAGERFHEASATGMQLQPFEPADVPRNAISAKASDSKDEAKAVPFAKMDPIAQRDEIARRLGREAHSLLPSDLKRFGDAIIAQEAKQDAAANAPKAKGVAPKTINGMDVTSPEFLRLDPTERIRLARLEGAKS